MKTIYLDKLYFAEIRKVKQIDYKGQVIEFPENVYEVSTGVANYGKLYYYADENKLYDLFVDKKDDKKVMIRVELNFYIDNKLENLTVTISRLVELYKDNLPDIIVELQDEEQPQEEPIEEPVEVVVEEATNGEEVVG